MTQKLWKVLAIGLVVVLAIALPMTVWAEGGTGSERDDAGTAAPPAVGLPFVWDPTAPSPDAVLWDNGPVINAPGGGPGGTDGSVLQTSLGMNTYGFGDQVASGNHVSDQFTVTQTGGWQIDTIDFFAYQTGSSTTSTINDVRVQIWNGNPMSGGTVIWGNLTTNRLASSVWMNAYRYSDTTVGTTRPIMRNTATINTVLQPGTYWVDWMIGGTLTSGPWAPPITVNGVTATGDGLQYTTSGGAWAPALDSGTSTQQGFPFVVRGSLVSPTAVNVAAVQAQTPAGPTVLFLAVIGLVLAGGLLAFRARA